MKILICYVLTPDTTPIHRHAFADIFGPLTEQAITDEMAKLYVTGPYALISVIRLDDFIPCRAD